MKADYLSFKRATSVSLLGLVFQLGIGLTLLVYGLISRDHAAQTAGYFALAGTLVWLTLAIVFDQHRRERIEALELESLNASGAREASVFGERDDDLRVAAKRLSWMHRFLVPGASIALALALLVLGLWRFRTGKAISFSEDFVGPDRHGWAMGLGFATAFIGFLFARYVSGLAKQPIWANLRAGAAITVGAALMGLLLGVGHAADYAGYPVVLRYLPVVLSATMFVLAAEITLNFLLGIYRPRRPGEIPRAAMESRILGFAASPDRIAESIGGALNYQFGFDVTGSWFYQLLSRSVVVLAVVGLVVLWGMTSVGVVQPNEQAIRVRLGRQVGGALGPGPYLKAPWPFERLDRFDASTLRELSLGGTRPDNIKTGKSVLWTNDHGVAESYFIVQPSEQDRGAAGRGELRDVALVSVEVTVQYFVDDLVKFQAFAAPDQRESLLKSIGQQEVFKHLSTESVDRILGHGRSEASEALRAAISRRFEKADAGVKVAFVGIEGVHPPKDTADMFEAVVQNEQKRQTAVTAAEQEASERLIRTAGSIETARRLVKAIDEQQAAEAAARAAGAEDAAATERVAEAERAVEKLLTEAGGEAGSLIQRARADRWTRHMNARGQSERYAGRLASYQASPAVFMSHAYFQTLEEVMKTTRVFIVTDDGPEIVIRPDLKEEPATGNLFETPKTEE